ASGFVARTRMECDLGAAVGHARAGRAFVPSAAVLPRSSRTAGRRHDLQLYGSDAFLAEAVTAFFESALEGGNSIIAVATPLHLRVLDTHLTARRLDLAALVASGRCT